MTVLGARKGLRIGRLSLLLLAALLLGCPTTRLPPAGLASRGDVRPAHLTTPGVRMPGAEAGVGERAARGLDRVRIVRTWRAPMADGSTDLVLDVFNGGSRPLAGLVIDLLDEAAGPDVTAAQTCHLEVWIPVGRVARASCARPLTGPARLVPHIVDVYWQ